MTVYITGMGCTSALGSRNKDTLAGFREPVDEKKLLRSGLDTLTFPAPLDREYDSNGNRLRSLDLLLQALDEALDEACLKTFAAPSRVGVCIGTTSASFLNNILFHRKLRSCMLDTSVMKKYISGNPSEFIKKRLELKGPAITIANACSSGTDAIGVGMSLIKSGLCDIVITGGADELHDVPNAGFYALGVTSSGICRPFDRDRDGLNLGEGAGVMILESKASVLKRGVVSTLTVAGYGGSNDAFHITQPDPEGQGIESAIRAALHNAGNLSPDQVGFINAHGTGTLQNDLAEALAFFRIFGGDCRYLSTKGQTGHTLGAAGAIEAVITGLMLRKQRIPASPGFCNPSEDIPMPPVAAETAINSKYAMSTSLAFGGCNSALLLKLEG
ncbi:MAG: beta-ketoacyl-[acyl-carrier-protein] synthase family protein [Victivallaceae bacterium]